MSNVALSSFTECFNCQLYTVASHYFFARFLITTGLVDILWVCGWNNNSLKLQKGSCRRIFIEQNDRMSAYRGRFPWRGYDEGLNVETSHTWIVHSEVFQSSGEAKDIFFKQYLPCTDKVYFDFEFLNDVEWFRKRLFLLVFSFFLQYFPFQLHNIIEPMKGRFHSCVYVVVNLAHVIHRNWIFSLNSFKL